MKIWMVVISFFLGALSVFLFRPISPVHANITNPLHVHVFEVQKGGDLLMLPSQGSQIVGFSCTEAPGQPRCFVATLE
jgi:hypothetical protein